jgi:hypothetical protein
MFFCCSPQAEDDGNGKNESNIKNGGHSNTSSPNKGKDK